MSENIIPKDVLIFKLFRFTEQIRHDGKIIAFYLFGSYAKGRPIPSSDVDLAVLFDESVNKDYYLMERLRLMGEVSTVLGIDAVELVVLNELQPALAYRIIKDGELLYTRDEVKKQLVAFKVKTMDRYFDFQPVQRMFSESLARRTREGGFGGR
ncbi:type VII toxin-antitoxin system MntA family adenylyltransferase antitoxin [Phosphitispora fastidiosa]|uniref:type VII toxin-antitoxin system MntA family adenylyltransferase antitoxin n=1 Tax=Phosphitispora fastidiosa TaxID=2837202 RepID=UPI001E431E72|nr:nucleotidyltransferase domain-containing protein [Phosphitispora fastidiosa]MBU7008056.1 putative nucleotidyltransferase [Phosphitispora fastidiosa]